MLTFFFFFEMFISEWIYLSALIKQPKVSPPYATNYSPAH